MQIIQSLASCMAWPEEPLRASNPDSEGQPALKACRHDPAKDSDTELTPIIFVLRNNLLYAHKQTRLAQVVPEIPYVNTEVNYHSELHEELIMTKLILVFL